MRRVSHILVLAAGSLVLAGCSGMDDRSRSIARCERTAAQGVENPQQAAELCGCIVDDLAAEGLTIMDMMGSNADRVQHVTRQCAANSGVRLPE